MKNETKAVRSLTKSIKSVMGITSHQMEGAARHMELPSTIPILSELGYIYEYLFVFQEIGARTWQRDCPFATLAFLPSNRRLHFSSCAVALVIL